MGLTNRVSKRVPKLPSILKCSLLLGAERLHQLYELSRGSHRNHLGYRECVSRRNRVLDSVTKRTEIAFRDSSRGRLGHPNLSRYLHKRSQESASSKRRTRGEETNSQMKETSRLTDEFVNCSGSGGCRHTLD